MVIVQPQKIKYLSVVSFKELLYMWANSCGLPRGNMCYRCRSKIGYKSHDCMDWYLLMKEKLKYEKIWRHAYGYIGIYNSPNIHGWAVKNNSKNRNHKTEWWLRKAWILKFSSNNWYLQRKSYWFQTKEGKFFKSINVNICWPRK